jgi:hypothetical protein
MYFAGLPLLESSNRSAAVYAVHVFVAVSAVAED